MRAGGDFIAIVIAAGILLLRGCNAEGGGGGGVRGEGGIIVRLIGGVGGVLGGGLQR